MENAGRGEEYNTKAQVLSHQNQGRQISSVPISATNKGYELGHSNMLTSVSKSSPQTDVDLVPVKVGKVIGAYDQELFPKFIRR